jgi:hypothetical protein
VDVELSITLPTGVVPATIIATETTLSAAATASARSSWDERDLVAVVSGVFASLATVVSVVAP